MCLAARNIRVDAQKWNHNWRGGEMNIHSTT